MQSALAAGAPARETAHGASITAAASPPEPPEPPRGRPSRQSPCSYTPKHLAERILRHRSAIEGERKHVTVLFADLAGFTAMSERLDPEEVHALMDRAFELILEEVHQYEGNINQFTGDGVMALFGAPVALEAAPRRAVQAALGIQQALQPLHEEVRGRHGLDFRMRVGINTGLVVVGRIGNDLRMDYTAVGDTTNLAARLQTACTPGSILVSEATHRLVAGFFETSELPPFHVKGKSQAVRAFKVLGKLNARSSPLAALGRPGVTPLTPMVGRQSELLILESCFQAACSGQGQLVLLEGEPGIGKTRLLLELRQRIATRKHLWLEGYCVSYGGSSALLPIVDALRRYLGIEDVDNESTAVAKIERGISSFAADVGWVLPYLRHLLSLPAGDSTLGSLDPVTLRSEIFRALRLLIDRTVESFPLVLVMEDLHWIDAASEEFLDYLIEGLASLPLMLVCTYRSEYQPRFATLAAATKLSLRGLSAGEMETMGAAVLGATELPEALRALIERKAEGNPLFIEEVTRSLVEQELVQREGERFVLTRDICEISVPDTIHDVIAARIDRLPEAPKRTMQLASIIGREFALRLLQSLGRDSSLPAIALKELRTLNLIYQKAIYPELAYMFKHALVHDVTYESILLQQRKLLHRLVGHAIEELYSDRLPEHYEVLAHHFTAAEDWPRALDYHERSAVKAAATYANRSVAEHCRKALQMADTLGNVPAERRHKLLERLGHSCFLSNEFQSSGKAFERAAEVAPRPGEKIAALANAAMSFTWGHTHERATALLDTAFALRAKHAEAPAAEGLLRTTHGYQGGVLHGDMQLFIDSTAKGIELGDLAGDEAVGAMSRCLHAMGLEWIGQYRKSMELNEQALAVGRREHLAQLVVMPGWFIAKAACCLGDYARAVPQLLEILDVTERIGALAWKTRALNTVGWCFSELGAHDAALSFNERAVALSQQVGDPEIVANSQINLAMNFLDMGNLERGQRLLESLRSSVERNDPFMRWRYGMHLTNALARLALAEDRAEEALALARQEHGCAVRHGTAKLQIRALLTQGRAQLALESPALAAESFSKARHLSASIEYHSGLWRSLSWEAASRERLGEEQATGYLRSQACAIVEGTIARLPEAGLQGALRREALALSRSACAHKGEQH